MKILILDNYDSFTYNLVQYVEEILEQEVDVFRNDEIELEEVGKYDCIIISPGPGIPSESGITLDVIKRYYESKAIFGVCLGLQAIVESFGGQIYNLDTVFHGISTSIEITDATEPIFEGIASPFQAGRYHSWAAVKDAFPSDLIITAVDEEGSIMALSHQTANLKAVQFHPESIMTPDGKKMLENFLRLTQKSLKA